MHDLTALDLMQFVLDGGGQVSHTQAQEMLNYFQTMLARERCLTFFEDSQLIGFCTFFLLTQEASVPYYHLREPWSTPSDDPDGTLVSLDFLYAHPWTKALRQEVEAQLADRFPQFEAAAYYRLGTPDRVCRIPRRANHVAAI